MVSAEKGMYDLPQWTGVERSVRGRGVQYNKYSSVY